MGARGNDINRLRSRVTPLIVTPALVVVGSSRMGIHAFDLNGYETWMRSWSASEYTIASRLGTAGRFINDHPTFPEVTPQQVAAWLARQGAGWTRHTYYGAVKSLFEWAVMAQVCLVNPVEGVRRPMQPGSAPRPLTKGQFDAVFSDARGNLLGYMVLGAFAGLRAHEIAKIKGQDVSPESLYVYGKGGKAAFVPTHPRVWAMADDRDGSGWWFPSTRNASGHVTSLAVSHAASRQFRRHGVEGSIHRLRHTYGTQLLRGGANIRVVQSLMRHESLATTAAYTQVEEAECTAAVHALGWVA